MNQLNRSQIKRGRRLGITISPKGTLDQIDGFILLGFGLNHSSEGGIAPGKSNLRLAQWVVDHNPHQLPTITQMGTYLALKELEEENPSLEVDRWAINLPHNDNVHIDTYGAALQIWLICENVGLQKVALVTHPWQSDRAYRIFKKLPISEIVMPDIPPTEFDPQSIQRWTRNPWLYLLYEFGMARPIGKLFGWI